MDLAVYGALGGMLPDALRLIRGRYEPGVPAYFKSPMFYVGLALCIAAGATAAHILAAHSVKEALAYGFSAPELLTRLLTTPSPSNATSRRAGRSGPRSLRELWSV
jgi:hypothetical protein